MQKLNSREIQLIFDPSETWQHQHQLDKDLADFLETKGLLASRVQAENGKSIFLVEKIKSINTTIIQNKELPQVGPKDALGKIFSDLALSSNGKKLKVFKGSIL